MVWILLDSLASARAPGTWYQISLYGHSVKKQKQTVKRQHFNISLFFPVSLSFFNRIHSSPHTPLHILYACILAYILQHAPSLSLLAATSLVARMHRIIIIIKTYESTGTSTSPRGARFHKSLLTLALVARPHSFVPFSLCTDGSQ